MENIKQNNQPKDKQFVQVITNPQQVIDDILHGVRNEIRELKKDFQPKAPTEYLSRSEVKELLKCDLSTIHNWTVKRKLKSYGIGNRVYYKRSEVEEAIIALK